MGKDDTLQKALYKALVASGIHIKQHGSVLLTVADKDKEEAVQLAGRFHEIGYRLHATRGTAEVLAEAGIPCSVVSKIGGEEPNLLNLIQDGNAQLVINTLTKGKQPERDGFRIRRESVENGIPCLTSLDTANAILTVLESMTFSSSPMNKPEKTREAVNL